MPSQIDRGAIALLAHPGWRVEFCSVALLLVSNGPDNLLFATRCTVYTLTQLLTLYERAFAVAMPPRSSLQKDAPRLQAFVQSNHLEEN